MSSLVIGAVLLGALLHASWNALVKAGGDRWLTPALIAGFSALFAVIAIPFLPLPQPHHWPWIIGSGLLHLTYFTLLIVAYGHGDFGRVYPIARGTAPLLVFAAAGPLLGESLSLTSAIAVAVIAVGVMSLAWERGLLAGGHGKAVFYAVLTGIAIAGYSLVDAAGIRAMSADIVTATFVYLAWIMIVACVPFIAVVGYMRWGQIGTYLRHNGGRGAGGAAFALASYALILWAYSQAPAAPVAAVRETGVIFAALIATLVLGEKFGARRVPAALLVAAGAAGLHLAT
ncbi:MAG: EamA family transporter [Alphaproteobacteria bacterium]|nr:EamA family transporter [Alphaproteobacteria bacterium]